MDDLNIESTPLQQTYREARRKCGKRAVELVLVAHGASGARLPDVPAAKRDKCIKALRALIDTANGVDAPRVPQEPAKLDAAEIYARWNAPKTDDD